MRIASGIVLAIGIVAVVTLGESIGSTVLAYLFLNETPTFLKILGAALILMGIVFTMQSQPNRRPIA